MREALGLSHPPIDRRWSGVGFRDTTHEEFMAEGEALFGPDVDRWRFVCPVCGYEAAARRWKEVGAPGAVAFNCIGRYLPDAKEAFKPGPGPCTYTGGGLFQLNPVRVRYPNGLIVTYFEFARGSYWPCRR